MDSIAHYKDIVPVNIVSEPHKIDWEPYVLIIASLSLIAAVIIPFAQKKYDEYRTKRSFKFYFKNRIGIIWNLLTIEKIEYVKPAIKDDIKKVYLSLIDFVYRFEKDFMEHKETVQVRSIFCILMNLQKLMHYNFRIRLEMGKIDFINLYDKTLAHGKELSKKELQNIYGLILIYQGFMSITLFHDKFGELKSIKRDSTDKIWTGLKLENDLLENQKRVSDDLLFINNNENSIYEIIKMVRILDSETKKYFDFNKLNKKRKTTN